MRDATNLLKTYPAIRLGDSSILEFPTIVTTVNNTTIHPRLLKAVSQLLGSENFKLKQSELVQTLGTPSSPRDPPGRYDNVDQQMHMQFPNHTMVHPPKWNEPDAVSVLIYLCDCNECGGSTAVVPREGDDDPAYDWPYCQMPGIGDIGFINDRETAESTIKLKDPEMYRFRQNLYEREKLVRFRSGTVLFFRPDVWHRQTPVNQGKARWTQNLVFARNDCEWVGQWQRSTTYFMYGHWSDKDAQYHGRMRLLEESVSKMSPLQRTVLGFPAPGTKYWNKETLEAVGRRYDVFGVDMTPYGAAIKNRLQSKL